MEAALGLDDGSCMPGLGSVAPGGAGGRRWSWWQHPACRPRVSASSADDFVSWFMYHKRRYTGSLERRAHSPDTGECARHLSRVGAWPCGSQTAWKCARTAPTQGFQPSRRKHVPITHTTMN